MKSCWSKPNFPPEAAYPFTGAPIGEFVSYQANRENSEIIGGGWSATPKMRSMAHPWLYGPPPPKKFPSPAAGLFWPLFLPLFYLCFYHYLYLQKNIFFACGGLVFTLSLPLFLPLFLTVFYLLFYHCLTFIFALFLPLFLPSKKFSSPAAGFFLRLVYLCFYLCF